MPPTAQSIDRVQPSPRDLRALIPERARRPSVRGALRLFLTYALPRMLGYGLVCLPVRQAWLTQALGALVIGVCGAKLFEVGHEAMHLNFSGSKRLDRLLAHLSFLPTLKPLSPAMYSHVQRHHRYTNIHGYDTQWSPTSLEDYANFSWPRRALEHVYRSPLGLGLYWAFEVVLSYYTSRGFEHADAVRPAPRERAQFTRHRLSVMAYIAANLALWPWLGAQLGLSPAGTLLAGFVCPVIISHWVVGAATLFQHTAPDVRWFESPNTWRFFEAQVMGTVELVPIHPLVMPRDRPHTVHHVDMTVPFFGLREAQDALDAAYPGLPRKTPPLSIGVFLDTVRRCKLYDFRSSEWVDFRGRSARRVSPERIEKDHVAV
jgi:omega-6 fatty acid desaturase (delta-12 desaturase)